MKEFGGYFELETNKKLGRHFHPTFFKLNSGRSALEYILRGKSYTSICLPNYYCDVLEEPIRRLGLTLSFYDINDKLEIDNIPELGSKDCLLYIDYFGCKSQYAQLLANKVSNIIIDNTQSFFSKPNKGVDAIYSCRKFFGVPDGGYSSNTYNNVTVSNTGHLSYKRYAHMVGRIDRDAESFYQDFKNSEESLSNEGMKIMSASTELLIGSIAYYDVIQRRNENFQLLHSYLGKDNELFINNDINGPLCYPYLGKRINKKKMVQNKVYVSTYWPNNSLNFGPTGKLLSEELVCLPIDQRYTKDDMLRMIEIIQSV